MSPLPYRIVRADEREFAETRPLLLLHGFLGAGRNWASFARRLVDWRPDWSAVLVDLPYHGDARGVSVPPTVEACAGEVARLARRLGDAAATDGGCALLGHSFGGKVALLATRMLEPPPRQTWIIDSTPASGGEGGSAAAMLERLRSSPEAFADREEAVSWIREGGFDDATARWMATNLEREGESWRWALDAEPLADLLADFRTTDAWRAVEGADAGADLHFVRASRGSVLTPGAADRIRGAAAGGEPVSLHELEGGHWLHVDNPDGLLELVADRLPRD